MKPLEIAVKRRYFGPSKLYLLRDPSDQQPMKGASHAKRVFTCLIVFAAWTIAATAQNADGAYRMKTVVIDAGHGGHDPGNIGTGKHKKKEKDIALDVALRVGSFISEVFPEIKVLYTRDTDVFIGLNERADVANKADADLFISIHCNAAKNPEAAGVETFTLGLHKNDENLQVAMKENQAIFLEDDYQTKYEGFDPNSPESIIALTIMQSAFLEQSLKISASIQKQFKEKVGRKDRGVKQAGFLVLRRTTMPSILIELGFLTNVAEENFLNSENGRIVMASAIFRGFKEYKEKVEGGASSVPTETEIKAVKEPVATVKPEEKLAEKPAVQQESAPKPAAKTPVVAKSAQDTEAERLAKQKQLEAAKAEQAKLEQQKKDNEARKATEVARLAAEKVAKEKALADAKRKAEEDEKAAQAERIHREAIAEQAKTEFATRLAEREKAKQDSVMQVHTEQRERRALANQQTKPVVIVEQETAKAPVPELSEKPLTPDEAELLYLEKRKLELEERIARIKGEEETAKVEAPKPAKKHEEEPIVKDKAEAKTPAASPASVDKGVVLSVQIMTSPSKLDVNSARFKGEKVHHYVQDGIFKYVVGEWKNVQEATVQQRRLRQLGFDGAFVVAFKGGVRITLAEARELLNE